LVKEPFDEREHSDRPLLDLARMPQRTIAPAETGKASELTTSRILFEPGDTLFGAIRCYLHKVLAAHYPGVTNTSVLVLRPKKANFRSLVVLIASDTDTIRWADTHSTGTKMPVINWGVFQTMPAPLPSELSAREFENVAGPMLEQIGILANQIQNLRRTRDLLLPRLLSGQIENLVCPTE
jgi:type I restriction enzyme, S subunit